MVSLAVRTQHNNMAFPLSEKKETGITLHLQSQGMDTKTIQRLQSTVPTHNQNRHIPKTMDYTLHR